MLWVLAESAFGIPYAYGVHKFTVAHPEHPYVWLAVVIGVAVTLGLTMWLRPELAIAGIWFAVAFALTGWPQVLGEIHRYTTKQTRQNSQVAQLMETIAQLERKVNDLQHDLADLQLEVGTDD